MADVEEKASYRSPAEKTFIEKMRIHKSWIILPHYPEQVQVQNNLMMFSHLGINHSC